MYRSPEETQELVAARVTNYVNGDYTEEVLKASLKILKLTDDEIKYELHKAYLKK